MNSILKKSIVSILVIVFVFLGSNFAFAKSEAKDVPTIAFSHKSLGFYFFVTMEEAIKRAVEAKGLDLYFHECGFR